jgi:hypothetical protein
VSGDFLLVFQNQPKGRTGKQLNYGCLYASLPFKTFRLTLDRHNASSPRLYYGRVSTQGPSAVTATQCSK